MAAPPRTHGFSTKSVAASMPTMRVMPTTEQQLSFTVCVKNCGVAWATPPAPATAAPVASGRYTLTGCAVNSTSDALEEAPTGSTMTSAPKRSRDSDTLCSSDTTTTADAATTQVTTAMMTAVTADCPSRLATLRQARYSMDLPFPLRRRARARRGHVARARPLRRRRAQTTLPQRVEQPVG